MSSRGSLGATTQPFSLLVNGWRGCERTWVSIRTGTHRRPRTPVLDPLPRGSSLTFPTPHLLALSLLLGQEADRDDWVTGFRERHLGASLLDLADVERWILAQAEEDGVATQYVAVPVPAGLRIQATASGELLMNGEGPLVQSHPATGAASMAKMLRYVNPQREPRALGTASAGVLEELRSASEHLVDRLRWGEADAATFILTGRPPLFAEIRAEQEWDELRPFASRITLHICPTAKPREVERVYAALRSQMLKGRHLQVRTKHAALVVFALPRRELQMPWQEVLEAWNQSEATRYEKGNYSQLSNLRRDYRKACVALLALGINLEGITAQSNEQVGPVAVVPGRTLVSSRFIRRGMAYQLLRASPAESGKTS